MLAEHANNFSVVVGIALTTVMIMVTVLVLQARTALWPAMAMCALLFGAVTQIKLFGSSIPEMPAPKSFAMRAFGSVAVVCFFSLPILLGRDVLSFLGEYRPMRTICLGLASIAAYPAAFATTTVLWSPFLSATEFAEYYVVLLYMVFDSITFGALSIFSIEFFDQRKIVGDIPPLFLWSFNVFVGISLISVLFDLAKPLLLLPTNRVLDRFRPGG
jgi:hypothetical protein